MKYCVVRVTQKCDL